ncbi:MAG TPA: sulfite exporter TauE/SafE family protein [Desulfurivibrionaceae bacterium]|nr:sulfite exporter TauE/SafE family protein [Desulfurivibrionaceae bacterium]
MSYLIICTVALLASGLTLFSGFGLGTLLMPVFALFFPIEVAIAQTALVHFANNLLKLGLFSRRADWQTVLLFGLPAFLASFAGARVLLWLADLAPLHTYLLNGRQFMVHPVKLVIALLMVGFSAMELYPSAKQFTIGRKYMPLGGLLSGFFGGLSGNQGAFRSVFLIKSGQGKEAFIGTGVVIAGLVDFSRLSVYAGLLGSEEVMGNLALILVAILAAFAGVFLGSRLVKKVTIRSLQVLVAVMLFLIAILLGGGMI